MKSMPWNDYIEFKNPKYVFLRLTPSTSIRNYNSDIFINLVSRMYTSFDNRVQKINNKLFFESTAKVGYYVYMEKSNVQFFFVVPEKHFLLFKDKIVDVWSNKVTILQVDEIPNFGPDCSKYALTYKNTDAYSLACDKRNNTLLSTQLNTVHIMEEDDKAGLFYNFLPSYTRGWRATWDNSIKSIKDGGPDNHSKISGSYILKMVLHLMCGLIDTLCEAVCMGVEDKKAVAHTRQLELSKNSLNKREKEVVKTQIICMSQSKNPERERNNAISLCNSFECLTEDNSLVYHRINGKVNLLDSKIKHADTFLIQAKEGQNFLSLPGRELLMEHKCIEHTSVQETQVPSELQNGYIYIGDNTCRGAVTKAYLRDTYDYGNMPLVLIGQQGSGKTTLLGNYAKCVSDHGEGLILIDYIKNCELADAIKRSVPASKVIEIDMSDIRSVQGIGYNELTPRTNSSLDILDVSNRKSLYIQMLIDAINTDGDPLSSSMDRFLSSASNIVFLDRNTSLSDVVRCLNNHEYRHQCIDYVPNNLRDVLQDEISALKELDEKDKAGVITGTRMAKIDGINSRINNLKKDLRLKMMYQKGTKDNIDLVKAMDEGKIVLFKMPQDVFSSPYSKNVVVTYLFTKVWSAALIRGSQQVQPKRFHVIVDEIFQAKTAMRLLKEQEILPQTRKFGAKFVFSCQYLGQIEMIDQTLRSAGASHMLLKGSGKANFNEFKDELAPYTLEDLEALPQYNSLNLINYEGGRAKFVTKLPKPL